MNFPVRIADQLKPHLRALRKRRGLTQAQLGALVGVRQARIAEIEANPGAVSLDQLTKLLAALGGTLHLHAVDAPATLDREARGAGRRAGSTASVPKAARAGARSVRPTTPPAAPAGKPPAAPPIKPTPSRRAIVIPAKKGTW